MRGTLLFTVTCIDTAHRRAQVLIVFAVQLLWCPPLETLSQLQLFPCHGSDLFAVSTARASCSRRHSLPHCQAKKRLAAKKKSAAGKKGGSAALLAKAAAEAKARASKKGKSKDKSSYNQVTFASENPCLCSAATSASRLYASGAIC